MNRNAMKPYGMALKDCFSGETSACIVIRRDDGDVSDLPVGIFFRHQSEFSPIEQAALSLCTGYVLDVGAGTGIHSLVLQDQGLGVCAIDIAPQAVNIMLLRGVREVHCANVFEFSGGPFDAILMMLHGIGLVETLAGLDRFLFHSRNLLQPGGKLILDSLDVRSTDDPVHLAYHEANRKAGKYIGEIRMRFEYKGQTGQQFGWLHVDPDTLVMRACEAGWSCSVVLHEGSGDYLAVLSPIEPD